MTEHTNDDIVTGETVKSRSDYITTAELFRPDSLAAATRRWELTRERIAKNYLGDACVKLVQIASFFSPYGFARDILRHLWGQVVYPELDTPFETADETFEYAVGCAEDYNVFQSTDPIRIRYFDRAVIQQTAKAEPGLEDAVGAALAAYGPIDKDDLTSLCEDEVIRKYLSGNFATGSMFFDDLPIPGEDYIDEYDFSEDADKRAKPQPKRTDIHMQDKSAWDYWGRLLREEPESADRCPWEQLDGWDWMGVLCEMPQYADRCPWEKLCGGSWAKLLSKQPQFANRCPWEKLDGRSWAWLLRYQPQFSDRCPWNKLDDEQWVTLLGSQPLFADRCPWERLNGRDWGKLLGDQPQFADRCSWEKLKGGDWAWLLCRQPQFAGHCQWDKLGGKDWSELLITQPQFADYCSWKDLYDWHWVNLLSSQPQFAGHCPWDKFDNFDWISLLHAQPQFADRCPREKFNDWEWERLVRAFPQLADVNNNNKE